MNTHHVTAVVIDRTLTFNPLLVEFETSEPWAALERLGTEFAAQHRGGHMTHEDNLEVRHMTVMRVRD